jgi:hypothetical protein
MYSTFATRVWKKVLWNKGTDYTFTDHCSWLFMSSPNVCVEREEIDESQHRNRTGENSGTDSDVDGGSILGSFQFSSCQQTDTKYMCTTK